MITQSEIESLLGEIAAEHTERANKRVAMGKPRVRIPRAKTLDVEIRFFTTDSSGNEIPAINSAGEEWIAQAETYSDGEDLAVARMFHHPFLTCARVTSRKFAHEFSLDRTHAVTTFLKRDKYKFSPVRK